VSVPSAVDKSRRTAETDPRKTPGSRAGKRGFTACRSGIDAIETERELVAARLADEPARRENHLDSRRGGGGDFVVRSQSGLPAPVGIPDVVEILGDERRSASGPAGAPAMSSFRTMPSNGRRGSSLM
jgi:hypothetical protein